LEKNSDNYKREQQAVCNKKKRNVVKEKLKIPLASWFVDLGS
jgi:hypothetical protein